MKDFENRYVYITGGSSGIGLETAKILSKEGAHIAIFARGQARLESSLEEIRKHAGNKHQKFYSLPLDVSDNEDIECKMKQAVEEFGGPDLLINSAGMSMARPFEEISPESFDHLIRVNLCGTRNVTAALVSHMKRKRSGTIVIVSSTAGLIPVYGYTAYGTSKYALVGLAECLRCEMKPHNINVSVLCPPEVDTPLVEEEAKSSPVETKVIKRLAGQLTADSTARTLIKGIRKNRFMIIPGLLANIFYYMQRFTPGKIFRSSSDMLVWAAGRFK